MHGQILHGGEVFILVAEDDLDPPALIDQDAVDKTDSNRAVQFLKGPVTLEVGDPRALRIAARQYLLQLPLLRFDGTLGTRSVGGKYAFERLEILRRDLSQRVAAI